MATPRSSKGGDEKSRLLYSLLDAPVAMADELSTIVRHITVTEHKMADRWCALSEAMKSFATDVDTPIGVEEELSQMALWLEFVQAHRRAEYRQLNQRVTEKLLELKEECRDKKSLIEQRDQRTVSLEKFRRRASKSKKQTTKIDLKRKERHYQKDEAKLDREMIHFESVKKTKMNAILKDLVTSQMVFFARGLELFSEAYRNLDAIDVTNPSLPPVLEKARKTSGPKKSKPARPSKPVTSGAAAASVEDTGAYSDNDDEDDDGSSGDDEVTGTESDDESSDDEGDAAAGAASAGPAAAPAAAVPTPSPRKQPSQHQLAGATEAIAPPRPARAGDPAPTRPPRKDEVASGW